MKPQNCLDDGPFYGQYKRGSDEFIGYLFLSILCCYDNCLANNDEEGEDDEDEDEFDMKEEQQVSHYILYQDDDSTTDDNTEGGVNIVSSDGSSLSSNCMSIGSSSDGNDIGGDDENDNYNGSFDIEMKDADFLQLQDEAIDLARLQNEPIDCPIEMQEKYMN